MRRKPPHQPLYSEDSLPYANQKQRRREELTLRTAAAVVADQKDKRDSCTIWPGVSGPRKSKMVNEGDRSKRMVSKVWVERGWQAAKKVSRSSA